MYRANHLTYSVHCYYVIDTVHIDIVSWMLQSSSTVCLPSIVLVDTVPIYSVLVNDDEVINYAVIKDGDTSQAVCL